MKDNTEAFDLSNVKFLTFRAYLTFFDKCLYCLYILQSLWCYGYCQANIKRERRFFQNKRNYSNVISKPCECLF